MAVTVAGLWQPFSYFVIELPLVMPRYVSIDYVPGEVDLAMRIPLILALLVIGGTAGAREGTAIAVGLALLTTLYIAVMRTLRMPHFEPISDPFASYMFVEYASVFVVCLALGGILMLLGRGGSGLWSRMWKAFRRSDEPI